MESRFTEVSGVRMRWEEEGEGTPVILLHGIPTSPSLWRLVMPLVRGARCLAWEMVGYGWSMAEGKDLDISVAAQTGYLLQWMDALEVERAVFCGHGLGGGVAQRMAVLHPHRVAGLVLTNCISYESWPIPSVRALRAAGPVLQRMPPASLKKIFGLLFWRGHDERAVARGCLDIHFAPYAQPGGAAGFVRQVRSLRTEDTASISHSLAELDVPTRLVWGAQDPFQKLSYARQLARDLSAPLERIPEARHFVPEDHPERVARAICSVLEELQYRPTSRQDWAEPPLL